MGETQPESCCLSWVWDNSYYIIAAIIIYYLLRPKLREFRHWFFATLSNRCNKDMNILLGDVKKDIFKGLSSEISHDPALRKIGALKILEIGVGEGTNFAHYPQGSLLTVVDPNPYFQQYYEENRKKFPNIQAEDIIVSTGEEMDMVPDNSVDVVVVTLVFCSVSDEEKVLKQILRVLVPGGKFYFFEHISEFDTKKHGLRKKIQSLLTVTGFWPFIMDNCHLNRNMTKALKSTGFSEVTTENFYIPLDNAVFQIVKPSLKGVATK